MGKAAAVLLPITDVPSLLLLYLSSYNRTMAVRHSGLQKDVLALYRKILRVATQKDRSSVTLTTTTPEPPAFAKIREDATSATSYACVEFRRQSNQVKRSDFKRIEYMIRKGEKHLKLMQMPGVQTVGGATTSAATRNAS
jgi:hypothetical protein